MKIALIRVYERTSCGFDEEWVKDHITEFTEVTESEFEALREFVAVSNRKNRNDDEQYLLVSNETPNLPKTIAEALEFADKKKREWRAEMEKMEKEKKAKEKELAKKKKLKESERLRKAIAEVEEYKKKLEKLEKNKKEK